MISSVTRFGRTAVPIAAAQAPPSLIDSDDYLDPAVVKARNTAARRAESEADTLPPDVARAGAPAYFRTYEQMKAALNELAAKYPDLVEVIDAGDTYEKTIGKADRDILLLRLTAKGVNDGRKPSALHFAGEHSREIVNPEIVLRHAQQLLEGYGTDAEATALLQSRVIDIVPMMNADGHAVVERGYSKEPGGDLMKRKNTAGVDGTDLNRNYDFHWGGPGAGTTPRSQTYRGPSAASEPEVQAMQQLIGSTKPGIVIDWHSYGKLNLFPWGDTREKAPDYNGLMAIASKFSTMNLHTPEQSIDLYPTSGTSKDWVYGTHKIPAFTIETGSAFHQNDEQFEDTWSRNQGVLMYADKIADAPLTRVFGPDVAQVATRAFGRGIEITASVSDATNGGQMIQAAEMVTDPLTSPGAGMRLQAADGAFDSPSEAVTGMLLTSDTDGRLVHVRAQDSQGNWGPLTAQWLRGGSNS